MSESPLKMMVLFFLGAFDQLNHGRIVHLRDHAFSQFIRRCADPDLPVNIKLFLCIVTIDLVIDLNRRGRRSSVNM